MFQNWQSEATLTITESRVNLSVSDGLRNSDEFRLGNNDDDEPLAIQQESKQDTTQDSVDDIFTKQTNIHSKQTTVSLRGGNLLSEDTSRSSCGQDQTDHILMDFQGDPFGQRSDGIPCNGDAPQKYGNTKAELAESPKSKYDRSRSVDDLQENYSDRESLGSSDQADEILGVTDVISSSVDDVFASSLERLSMLQEEDEESSEKVIKEKGDVQSSASDEGVIVKAWSTDALIENDQSDEYILVLS